jgi:hypothetical protein
MKNHPNFDSKPFMMRFLALSLFFLAPFALRAQTVSATWTFTTITGQTNALTHFILTPIANPSAPDQTFLLGQPLALDTNNCPGLTNGTVTTNVICGVFFQVAVPDANNWNYYTNFFPTNLIAGTNVNAWLYQTNSP